STWQGQRSAFVALSSRTPVPSMQRCLSAELCGWPVNWSEAIKELVDCGGHRLLSQRVAIAGGLQRRPHQARRLESYTGPCGARPFGLRHRSHALTRLV